MRKNNLSAAVAVALFCIAFGASAKAAQSEIAGKVFCGVKGVAGVVVTDGYNFTSTACDGSYTLDTDRRARFVYISTPSGYLPPSNGSRPIFYKNLDSLKGPTDFEIFKNPNDDRRHTFAVEADVQVTSKADLDKYSAVLADRNASLGRAEGDRFVLGCGDITGDSPQLYPAYIEMNDSSGCPVYNSIGNHDVNYYGPDFESSYSTFESYFGPICYSFNRGEAHYIVLDDCFYFGRDYYYMGYYDRVMLEFVRNDLFYVPKDKLVIISFHIPSSLTAEKIPFEYGYGPIADECVNASALYDAVKGYRTHLISGHMHTNTNIVHSDSLYEHNTGAVCGTWWCGDVCLDGTPVGYGLYTVEGTDIKWVFKPSGYSDDYQMRVYMMSGDSFLANVWNWDLAWKVEWYENGVLAGEMTRIEGTDPAAQALCDNVASKRYSWITSAVPTGHLFKAVPHNPEAAIEVRATDRFGRVFRTRLATPRR